MLQVWAEAMTIYRSGNFKMKFSSEAGKYLKEYQRQFMPEDTRTGKITHYLETYTGKIVYYSMKLLTNLVMSRKNGN